MLKRANQTVYRVRWRRQKWTCPRQAVFLSRKKAEQHRAKIEAAWRDGPNPLTWITLDQASVTWKEIERSDAPAKSHDSSGDRFDCTVSQVSREGSGSGWIVKYTSEALPGIDIEAISAIKPELGDSAELELRLRHSGGYAWAEVFR